MFIEQVRRGDNEARFVQLLRKQRGQLAGFNPLHELMNAIFNVRTVAGLLEFTQDFARHTFPHLGVRFQNKLLLLLRGLNQFISRPVGLDADENPNLLRFRERGMKPVKAADEEVADETIKQARVVTEQDAEAVAQAFARFIGDER